MRVMPLHLGVVLGLLVASDALSTPPKALRFVKSPGENSACSVFSGDSGGTCSLCTTQKSTFGECFWCSEDSSCHDALSPDYPSSCNNDGCVSNSGATNCEGSCAAGRVSGFNAPYAQCMLGIANASYYTGRTLSVAFQSIGIATSQYQLMTDSSLDTQGLVIAHPKANAVTIAFRGTILDLKNGELDIDAVLEDYSAKISNAHSSQTANWKVANGFASAYLSLQSQLRANLQTALGQVGSKPTLHITGHSLGAAMAAIAASEVILSNFTDLVGTVKVILFAPPRAGNVAFATDLGGLIPHWWGVQNYFDQIPHLPPQDAGYQHTTEIIIVGPNGGNIISVSPSQDSWHLNITADPISFHETSHYMNQLNALSGAASGPTSCPASVLN